MTKRLFLAINVPEDLKAELFELVRKCAKHNKNKPIKWVEQDNFHITLHFLGAVPEQQFEAIDAALEPIVKKFPALRFKIGENIDAFPDLTNPRVIYLELKEIGDGMTQTLHAHMGNALKSLGFEIDNRRFRMHITLGRVKNKTAVRIPNIEIPAYEFEALQIDLMESQLTSQGSLYTIFKNYFLHV